MRRREFLAGSIALAAGKTALPSSTWAQSAPRINRIIDAHCHIFNATDLPIEGFTKKIMVPKSAQTSELVARFADYPGALEALVHAITLQVKRAAPDLQSEIDTIDGFERDVEKKPTTDWRREQDRGHLRNVLRLIWFNWDVFSDRPLSLTEGIVLEVALEQIKLFLIQQIHEGFGKPDLTAEDREVLGGLTPYQVDAMADELYSRDDLLGRYIRWALLYTRNRYELAEELDQLHGKVAQKSLIGSKLDAALAKLYSWCSANNVPIMAHTSHSFGPNTEYEDRADPIFWAGVLSQDAFPRLRVNLAHFGHFNNAVQHARPQDHVDKCWEWTVGKILTNSAEAYADISSLGEILKTGPSRKIVDCMKAFKEHFHDSDERLLYGTDWSMIAQEERFPKLFSSRPFPDVMIFFLRAVGYSDLQIEGIMFRNAVRFLGLGQAERDRFGEKSTRGRLEKFYAAHKLSSEWMSVFD